MLPYSEIRGHKLHAADGEIGSIDDLYFDDVTWDVRYLVVDVGSWMTGRKVLLIPRVLTARLGGGTKVEVALTKDQIRNSPEIDTQKTVSRSHEIALHSYYGWPLYWGTGSLLGGTRSVGFDPTVTAGLSPAEEVPPMAEEVEREAGQGDPHLRSARGVHGYRIHARDGEIGSAQDLIVDDSEWRVRYLVVSTGGWVTRDHVLIAPAWIKEISWPEASVHVDLLRKTIAESPAYDPARPVTRDYEERLLRHYRQEVSSSVR